MSQFLICKSYEDLSSYGCTFLQCKNNKLLYSSVIEKYINGNFDNIWIIERISKWIDDTNKEMNFIYELIDKSDILIFWYGTDYDDLDVFYSKEEMIRYIDLEIEESCVELYIFGKLR